MASSRAEGLARYAEAIRCRDITDFPSEGAVPPCDHGPTFLEDAAFAAGFCVAVLVRFGSNRLRIAVMVYALVIHFPILPALLSGL